MKRTIITITVCILLLLSACSESECETDADCYAQGKCTEAYCSDKTCNTRILSGCCGNDRCDGRENRCTCETDCGNCSYVVDIKGEPASYLKMSCNTDDMCVPGYGMKKQTEFFNEFAVSGFKFNIYVTYDQPFDVTLSDFEVQFNLKDMDFDTIKLPININDVRIMESNTIIGKKARKSGLSFTKIGSTIAEPIVITYTLTEPEEEKRITVNIDYEYTKDNEIIRDTYSFDIDNPITFVDLGLLQ